ncbi:hypothetical protein LOC67_24480 [Stieleria sp. JC731]|uniref:hypothetical protein n=1 Tax=Pirellulaceae TaxID=2691357 RepID=UPI001E5C9A81|nr:hypothetical protein [Stieleria sp. JC731]MCC9603719.1 hypothetical protein [Stieleria sp. JC731]
MIFFLALGIASLRNGGLIASISVVCNFVFVAGIAVVAFVGADKAKAFSIGFLVPVVLYSSALSFGGEDEFYAYRGDFPSTQAIGFGYRNAVRTVWIDRNTGDVIPDFDRSDPRYRNRSVREEKLPDPKGYMIAGQMFIAVFLGISGGKLACIVFDRHNTIQIESNTA